MKGDPGGHHCLRNWRLTEPEDAVTALLRGLCCFEEAAPIEVTMKWGGNEPEFCHVEEIFFQANSKELYDKYFTGFKKSLETIEFKKS